MAASSSSLSSIQAVGIIPARWHSTRYPGKMLAELCGRPLILWVLERARQARRLDEVFVATDDARIRDVVEKAGGRAVMTRPDHVSGTDRIAEALGSLDVSLVVNCQGDEPMLDPGLVDRLVETLVSDPVWDMATAAAPIAGRDELQSADVVKVVTDATDRALYFSRSVIPCVRDAANAAPEDALHWRHIGIYAYRAAVLRKLVAAPPCAMEAAEKLEQLRALYLGCRMKVLRTASYSIGVDTPADLRRAEQAMMEGGRRKDEG